MHTWHYVVDVVGGYTVLSVMWLDAPAGATQQVFLRLRSAVL